MSIVTKSILKGYFETGDRPTEGQFIDLIDSLAVLGTNTNDITFIGTVTATTGSFGYLNLTGNTNFDSIDVGGGYGNTGLTITNTGQLSTDDYILTETYVSASTFLSTPKIKSPSTDFIIIQNAITVQGSITASGDISVTRTGSFGYISSNGHITASTLQIANNAQFGESTVYINSPLGDISASGRISASGGFEAGQISTSSFGYISASGDISASGNVYGNTGSFGHLKGDGSGLTGVTTDGIHGNKPSTTGSITIPENTNNTVVTNNTGEFTINDDYTVKAGAQVDLQYTPIAERLYRYDVDTGNFIPYAQANIDSETTLMKGFGAATAGVGNDSTIRHNATVPENFVTILHTTTNVTQSEDPNNNPMTTDPHSITIQDQSTYTIKSGADVTVDGVHHGVVRKDIALFKTMGIGDTQAIGPSGSNSFNDQYNNIYPSASAHLHISASNPVVKIEAASGTGLLSIDGNISASGGTVTALSGSFSHILGNSPITIQDPITFQSSSTFTGHITASGDISASGIIYGVGLNISGKIDAGQGFFDKGQRVIGRIDDQTRIESYPEAGIGIGGDINLRTMSTISPPGFTSRIFITGSTGNVGIGTGTPGEKLTVEGNISASGNFYLESDKHIYFAGENNLNTSIRENGGNLNIQAYGHINVYPDHDFKIYSGSTLYATFDGQTQGLQLGSTNVTPPETLTVEGNISSSGNIITTNVTASGNISASGKLYGTDLYLGNKEFADYHGPSDTFRVSPLSNPVHIFANVTASGNISSSGYIVAQNFATPGKIYLGQNIINTGTDYIEYNNGGFFYKGRGDFHTDLEVGTTLLVNSHITASGDISASGDITGVTGSFEGGLVLSSPDGTKYRFTTNDSGHLSLTGSAV